MKVSTAFHVESNAISVIKVDVLSFILNRVQFNKSPQVLNLGITHPISRLMFIYRNNLEFHRFS